ncbi:hypothetical protein NO1_1170, partial [Candidatus Termititenax aidoneus]
MYRKVIQMQNSVIQALTKTVFSKQKVPVDGLA